MPGSYDLKATNRFPRLAKSRQFKQGDIGGLNPNGTARRSSRCFQVSRHDGDIVVPLLWLRRHYEVNAAGRETLLRQADSTFNELHFKTSKAKNETIRSSRI
jgi:hypothetical protein